MEYSKPPFLRFAIVLASIHPISSFSSNRMSTIPTHILVKSHQNTGRVSMSSEQYGFSHNLIECLDLLPIVRSVSDHAATRRGKQAILSLVCDDQSEQVKPIKSGRSSRNRCVSGPALFRRQEQVSTRNAELAPIATSSLEAREEYEFVEQALLALTAQNGLSYPPIYAAHSSPFDTQTTPDSDDDEWMYLPADQLSLEHVLQAEQLIKMLLRVKQWCSKTETETWIPGLAKLGETILDNVLKPIQLELDSAVEIVRVKSITDPNGRSLRETKFLHLKDLRQQEVQLVESIETEMKIVLRKQKGSTECVDFEGRMVVLIPKTAVTSDFGIVRGTTENGGRCYVEPRHLINLGDELQQLRDELQKAEAIIEYQIVQTILQAAPIIDAGMHAVARLDVLFSKAAFGTFLHGKIPKIGAQGRIIVDNFVHPLLALQNKDSVVPVDLRMYTDLNNRVLIISGPNGGGKSLAMKSFGLVCILVKMALPIPIASSLNNSKPVVDFFENVFIEMGDQQNIVEGESTYQARLNCLSSVIQQVSPLNFDEKKMGQPNTNSSLVLLDELGGGTDPSSGGAIAQAILEKLLESVNCRIVATSHSPRLKALSYSNEDFDCATVMLKRSDLSDFKLPTYQLQYGLIGDSYALGAASRTIPRLPDDVLSRAATLLSISKTANDNDGYSGELFRAMTESLEKQIQAAEESRQQAEKTQKEALDCRAALISLSNSYQKQLEKLEGRLQNVYNNLQEDDSKSNLDVVGETLATIRIAKKKVKSEEERLRDSGLKRVSDFYEFRHGESVVVICSGELEGLSGTIIANVTIESCKPGQVVVAPSLGTWADPFFSVDGPQELESRTPLILSRHHIAIWDYDSVWDDDSASTPAASVRESRQRLSSLLTSLPSDVSKSSPTKKGSHDSDSVSFTSSRQRKGVASATKKRKKKN